MSLQEILYGVLIISVVVITVTLVWVANDLKGLLDSMRKSAQDAESVTKEIREKVMMVSEALDRVGASAAAIIGLIEGGVEQIKEKRDAIASSIGLVAGAGKAIKESRAGGVESGVKDEKDEGGKEEKKESEEEKPKEVADEKEEEVEVKAEDSKPKVAKKVEKDPRADIVDSIVKESKKKDDN